MAFRPFQRAGLQLLAAIALSFSACKKETEIQVKEVDKVYSWQADRHLYGLSKVILGMGQDATSLYLQTPGLLRQVSPRASSRPYVQNLSGGLPSDVTVRTPIAATIAAWPLSDTLVTIAPNAEAGSTQSRALIRLRQLDPQATTYRSLAGESGQENFRFAAINANNYLLMGYRRTATTAGAPVMRLVLAHVTFNAFQRLQVQSRVVDFPTPVIPGYPYINQITAIDNYFLVGQTDGGLFKVTEDGTIRLVSPEKSITAIYKWQGKVYAQQFSSNLLVSADAGETWTTYTNVPAFLRTSGFRVLGDSLVSFVQPFNQLYSLRWNGRTGRVRELKNDGLGETTVTSIAQLGDTVYVGTTSGLFKRPRTDFFQSKPQ